MLLTDPAASLGVRSHRYRTVRRFKPLATARLLLLKPIDTLKYHFLVAILQVTTSLNKLVLVPNFLHNRKVRFSILPLCKFMHFILDPRVSIHVLIRSTPNSLMQV
jgi:hypothetical protein